MSCLWLALAFNVFNAYLRQLDVVTLPANLITILSPLTNPGSELSRNTWR